jgi:hypothetical protein
MLEALGSSLGFTVFVSAFALSAGFWGRLLLKALKIPGGAGYGEPLTMVAFASALAVVARYLFLITRAFEMFFLIVFVLGFLGFVLEFVLKLLKSFKEGKKIPELWGLILERHGFFLVFLTTAFILSLAFCLSSPYRMLDPWVGGSMDYYSWVFVADVFRGDFDLGLYRFNNLIYFLRDCFGSNVLFSYFSAAKGETALMASLGFVVMLFSWIGTGVYSLIRDATLLPRPMAFLLSLSFVSCDYLVYLAENGNFSYLTAFVAFPPLIEALYSSHSGETLFLKVRRLFFPVLFLFLTYNGGFVPLLGMAYLCSLAAHILSAGEEKRLVSSLWKIFKDATLPLALAVLASLLIVPQAAYFMGSRVIDVIRQQAGYSQGFLDPRIFLGTPLIDESLRARASDASLGSWVVFLASLWVLLLLYLRAEKGNAEKGNAEKGNREERLKNSLRKTKVLFILFFLSLLAYLFAYLILGDTYKVWKLASYTALPFSFIPLSLLFLCLGAVFKGKRLFYGASVIVVAALIFSQGLRVFGPYLPIKVFGGHKPLFPLMVLLSDAHALDKDKKRIIYDLNHPNSNFGAAVVSEREKSRKVIVHGGYFLQKDDDFIKFLDPETILYSDREHPHLVDGRMELSPFIGKIHRYDYKAIREKGAVVYDGFATHLSEPERETVGIKVMAPESLMGKDLTLTVNLFAENQSPGCRRVFIHIEGEPGDAYRETDISDIRVPIQKELIKDGVFKCWLLLPGFPEDGAGSFEERSQCGIRLWEVALKESEGEL